MAGRNRSLEGDRRPLTAELSSTIERRETAADEEVVPVRAILLQQQDGLSQRVHARLRARRLDLHERHEPVDLRLLWSEFGQDATEAERLFAERRTHPVVTGSRRVAFIKDEVDHLQDGGQTSGKIRPARNFKGNARFAEGPLGPDDALGDRRLRNEESTRDLVCRQPPEQAECQRNPRLRREHRVAADEYEAQEVVADAISDRRVEIRHSCLLPCLEFADKLLVLRLKQLGAAAPSGRALLLSSPA